MAPSKSGGGPIRVEQVPIVQEPIQQELEQIFPKFPKTIVNIPLWQKRFEAKPNYKPIYISWHKPAKTNPVQKVEQQQIEQQVCIMASHLVILTLTQSIYFHR